MNRVIKNDIHVEDNGKTFIEGFRWAVSVLAVTFIGLALYEVLSNEEFPSGDKKSSPLSGVKLGKDDIRSPPPNIVREFLARHPTLADYVYIKNDGDVLTH